MVENLLVLSEFQIQLSEERSWESLAAGIEELGLGREIARVLLGIDMAAEMASTTELVDDLIERSGRPEFGEPLSIARRADHDIAEQARLFVSLEGEVAAEIDALISDLYLSAAATRGGSELWHALVVLETAVQAQRADSTRFGVFLRLQYSQASESSVLVDLVASMERWDEVVQSLDDDTTLSGSLQITVAALNESELLADFAARSRGLIDESFEQARVSANGPIELVIEDVDSAAFVFRARNESSSLHRQLVADAAAGASAAGADIGTSAATSALRTWLFLITFAGSTFVFAVAANRAVGRPLRHLAATARRLSNGESDARFAAKAGPREILDAARAINEAASFVELAERQTAALADGDLDNSILAETNTGRLGASLQHAVQTLAFSMHRSEVLQRQMAHDASHDGLTQLPNRRASLVRLRHALAQTRDTGTRLAVIFIDLDGFKAVNDQHGHYAGDHVLQETSQRLIQAVREQDHVGRLGGDEFIVVAEGLDGDDEAVALAQRLIKQVAQPMHLEGAELAVHSSVGIATSDGTEIADATRLLRDADLAVYEAKSRGAGQFRLCDDEMRLAEARTAETERAVTVALDNNEMTLHFQPIVDPMGAWVGIEALVRWNRSGSGIVHPSDFIPLAERSDLILKVDRWVLYAAARQLVQWQSNPKMNGLPLSVNISGRHLSSDSFVEDVLSPLTEHALDHRLLIVELTETALLQDPSDAAARLQKLRRSGVRVAVDDFGTGYASLTHLRNLTVDVLKIDRSYVTDPSAEPLIQLIIDTGHLLGASITAEGIETPEQAERLTGMGVDALQGYLYGKPQASEHLVKSIPGWSESAHVGS